MPFSSIIFIFIFLPLFLILFYLVPGKTWRNTILVLASLFYFGWADPTHIPQLLFLVIFDYACGRMIGYFVTNQQRHKAKIILLVGVIVNLLGLFLYKYLGFFGNVLKSIISVKLNIPSFVMPLGISYLVFSGISYFLDIYSETESAEANFVRFSAYLIMFPKLLQGPITRFGQVKNDLLQSKRFDLEGMMEGARRFIIGFSKKILLADSMAVVANKICKVSPSDLGAGLAWYGLIAYTLLIYFDFSGYTDMAIGLGKMVGFNLPENFNYPYISRSITEFWRRWHMTLTNWFRTYVFLPLEFARKKEKLLRQQTDIIIVFLLTGLWHGAGWNYVIWGGYFGLILAIEASGWGKKLNKAPIFIQHFYSIFLIMIGWVFFRYTNLNIWGPYFKALFGFSGWSGVENLRSLNIFFYIPIMFVAIIISSPIGRKIEVLVNSRGKIYQILIDLLLILLFVFSVYYLLSNGYKPFLYSQF